jgi:hypothetical protein
MATGISATRGDACRAAYGGGSRFGRFTTMVSTLKNGLGGRAAQALAASFRLKLPLGAATCNSDKRRVIRIEGDEHAERRASRLIGLIQAGSC